MRIWRLAMLLGLASALVPAPAGPRAEEAGGVLRLHPENPRYFLWRGKPLILITSGEHYGALLNLDFDYAAYFEALAADGMNGTRTWSGAYVETSGNFNIADNTLDPASGRFICPWARSDVPGYADGGNKFDLARWDEAYFRRLADFCTQASKRGIIVEFNLFCPMYEEAMWTVSPMNSRNNVNGIGAVARDRVYTLDPANGNGLLKVQEAMVRKVVAELRDFDNLYYEVCNEPYTRVPLEWEHRIVDVIVEAQKDHGAKQKLISRNIANGSEQVEDPHPAVSIFNFHYATPPDAVALNYGLRKVIGDNETGFRGTGDDAYRTEAWDFIHAGGGLFNHLDYSFTVKHPRGTWTDYPATQPGGGSPALRKQFRILRDFINGFDFIRMVPDGTVIRGGVPAGGTARALVEEGKAYAVYVRRVGSRGPFSARWTGTVEARFSEEYTFHTYTNDGVRLEVDGKQIIDNWTDHSETEDRGAIALQAGRKYPVQLEYFYGGGQGAMKLHWSSKSQAKEAVPAERLTPPEGEGRGLRGEYFLGKDLRDGWRTRLDATVDFAWGTDGPFPVKREAGETVLEIDLPAGAYAAEWMDVLSGEVKKAERFEHAGGGRKLAAPAYGEDIALRVKRA
jgi:hypothetical protein